MTNMDNLLCIIFIILMEELYYEINHKSTLKLMDNTTFSQLKVDFFLRLTSMRDEVNFSNTINKFILLYTKIPKLTSKIKDKIKVIEELCGLYVSKMSIDINDSKQCLMLCKKLSMRNYKTEFVFQSADVEEIVIILCYGFSSFINDSKVYNKNAAVTYKSFIHLAQFIREANIDIVNQYRYDNDHINTNANLKSNVNHCQRKHNYGIPNELILIMNKLSAIKKLVFNLDEWSDESILAYTLIIINHNWIFYYILDVTFDVSCVLIQKRIWTIYERELYFLNKEMKRKSSVGSNDSDNATKAIENETISDLIDNQRNIFLLIVLYSHFISKLPHLTRLSISIPQNYRTEIRDSLFKLSITMKPSFHFLNLLAQLSSLSVSVLSIEFNSLETSTFENVIAIIHNNTKLKYLTLGLFYIKDDHYYSSPSIYKTGLDEGVDLFSISSKDKHGLIFSDVFSCNSNDFTVIDNALLRKLLPGFESNMKKLFLIIQSTNLISFELYFDIPKRLMDNEQYYFALIKFIFNIFLLLNKERLNIKELHVSSPMMLMDNRRYPLLENFFDGINMFNKNESLNNLNLHFNFISLTNIANVLSVHLTFISIGDLDLDSFNALIAFFLRNDFKNKSALESLSLSLSKSIYDYNSFKPELAHLMKLSKPLTLNRLALHCNAVITAIEMKNLLLLGNGNHIEKYSFSINQISKDDYADFDYDKFYYYPISSSSELNESFKWTIIQILASSKALSNNIFTTVLSFANKVQLKRRKEVVIQMHN